MEYAYLIEQIISFRADDVLVFDRQSEINKII